MSIETYPRPVVNIELRIDHERMDGMRSFGQFVRKRREARGVISRVFAAQLDIDPSTLSRLENGGMKTLPDPMLLRRIADALAVTMPDLLEAAGYLTADDRQTVSANPFPPGDIRHRVVEAMKTVDLTGPDAAFWQGHFALELRMYRDIAAYGLGGIEQAELDTTGHIGGLDDVAKDFA